MIEEFGEPFILLVPREGIEIIESLVDASEFIAQHLAASLGVAVLQLAIGPVAHPFGYGQRLLIARIKILVDKTGEDFMEGIPGSPHPLPQKIAVDEFLWKSAQIALIAQSLLNLGKSGHKTVALELENLTARGRIHKTIGRKKMARGVAAQIAVERFPAAIFLHALIAPFHAGEDAGVVAEAMKHTPGGNVYHPRRIALEVLAHAARQQSHFLKVETFGFDRGRVSDCNLSAVLSRVNGLRIGKRGDCGGSQEEDYTFLSHYRFFLSHYRLLLYDALPERTAITKCERGAPFT